MPKSKAKVARKSARLNKRVEDFSEELESIGHRAERQGRGWDSWFHRTFGVVGPFISALFGIIIFALCVTALGIVDEQTGSPVLGSIHTFLLGKEGVFFLIFLFFSYMSYLSRANREAYAPFSPILGGIAAAVAFWLVAEAMHVVNVHLGISALAVVSSWIIGHLLWIFALALFVGYLALVVAKACNGHAHVETARVQARYVAEKGGIHRLYRSGKDRLLGGVCGGIAEYLGVDPVIIRLLWVICVFLWGAGVLAYIVAWIIIPRNPAHKWA